MDTASWERLLAGQFPGLSNEGFQIVEQASSRYNCIAYAAGDTTDWWWQGRYWPPWAAVNHDMESLKELFAGTAIY